MSRDLILPMTARYDCHASVSTQQKDAKKKKCRKAAVTVQRPYRGKTVEKKTKIKKKKTCWKYFTEKAKGWFCEGCHNESSLGMSLKRKINRKEKLHREDQS